MTTRKKLQLNGLWTYRDKYSNEPEGALSECDNINLDKLNIASPRIGFKSVDAKTSTDTYIGNMYNFGGRLILSTNAKIYGTSTISYSSDPSPSDISGALPPPLNCKYHSFASASSNLYATTASGVYYWTGSGTFAPTGMPKPPILETSIVTSVGSPAGTPPVALPFNNVQMAYRSILTRYDSKDQLYVSAPSDRIWTASTSATFSVKLKQLLPPDAVAGNILQIYRTKTVAYSTTDNASDECFLTYELVLTSSHLSAGYVEVYDITTDGLLGAALYTNSSQEGIQQAADRPPLAEILEPYQGYLMFGGITSAASQTLALVSQLSTGGTDTVTLKWKNRSNIETTLTLTGVAGTPSTDQFKVSSDVGSVGLQATMDSLASAINLYAKASGTQVLIASRETEGAVGQIRISVADVSAATIKSFTMAASSGAKFEPVITTAVEATETANRHRLMYSKYLEPEAVPTANFFDVGDSTEAIIALKTLRDKLIIIKERSIWKLTGGDPTSFGVQLVDGTTTIRDGRTVQSLGGKIYALSTQGVISISETVQIISRRITDKVTDIAGDASAWTDEEHGLYILNPLLNTAGYTELIVYNTFNDLYTTWSFTESTTDTTQTPHSGITINSRTIMASKESTLYINKMTLRCQRGYWNSDDSYGDDDLSVDLAYTSPSGTITASSTTDLQIGTKLYEKGGKGIFQITGIIGSVLEIAIIVSPDVTNTTGKPQGVLQYDFYKPVNSTLTFWPFMGEGIEVYKEFKELAVISAVPVSGQIEVVFSNDISTTSYTYTIASSSLQQGWGQFPWGLQPWGGVEVPSNIVERALVPAEVSKAHKLDIKINFVSNRQKWEVSGVSLNYRNIAFTPNNRGDV